MSFDHASSPFLPRLRLALAAGVRRRSTGIAAYLVLGALTLSPLLWATVPPLVDYPDHLARMWILLHARDIPALAQNYIIDWRLLPNLAMDLVVPALAKLLPLEAAGRCFIALTMANLVFATMALHRVLHGRVGLWPLCSLLFVYNAVLFWGFLNFLFALGLALLMFSAWLATERWRARTRVIVFSLPAALLLLLHLFAFGIYGLLVASHELGKRWGERRWSAPAAASGLLLLAQFIPAALLWWSSLQNSGPVYTHYGDLAAKNYALLAPGSFGASPVLLDRAIVVFALAFYLYARHIDALRLSPKMRIPIAAMFVLALLMPNWVSGSWGADFRLPVALPFVVIASTRFETARRAPAGAFAVAALALLGLRVWAVSASWQDADHHFAEFRAASRSIPEGVRLLVVQTPMSEAEERIDAVPAALAKRQDASFSHMAELAVIDRGVFVPYLFTGWTPVRPNPRHAAIFESQGGPMTPAELVASASAEWRHASVVSPNPLGELPYWRDWPETFDFVLWLDLSRAPPALGDDLQLWASGSFFRIFRIVRP